MFKINTMNKNSIVASILMTAVLLTGISIPAPAQKTPASNQTATVNTNYPRTFDLSTGGTVTLFEPQIESWQDQSKMVAWSALSYVTASGAKPAIGSIKITAETDVSADHRLVKFTKFKIDEINISSISREETYKISSALQAEIPESDRTLALDKVLAAVSKSQLNIENVANPNVKVDPPKILFSTSPAILIGFDGDPIWSPIKDVDLKFAVNTNWDVFQHTATNTYYLRNEANWFRSVDLKTGWVPAGKLPDSFSKLPSDENWKEVKASMPGKKISASKMPRIVVVTSPAEMIMIEGEPKYTPVNATSLLWVNNTESDLFRNGKSGEFYYLVAGRWFSATTLDGPWTFATPRLPAEFRNISVEHPRSRVLASIPGTPQATEAILQATIPRTARVNKNELKAPEVIYQGEPTFSPIEGTSLSRAVNTDKDIIKFGDLYYLCFQGVWFVSTNGTGPWTVLSEVPKEIYSIPASSPLHNVTYVTVKDDDPSDEWVTFTYVAAYTGMMITYGCVVWGTGWYYPPFIYYGGYYPIYYPYYRTYGYAAWYNPYMGTFGRGAAIYGPYGGVGFGAVYNPYSGTYARGATAYGPYGSRTFAQAYNPRTGTYAQTRQGNNIYGSWGSTYVQRGDDWVQTGRVSNKITGNSAAGIRTGDGAAIVTGKGNNGRATIGRTEDGDIYAGRDGNVYKNTGNGWQKYENGNWNSTSGSNLRSQNNSIPERPNLTQKPTSTSGFGGVDSSTYEQLNRDRSARREGSIRTNDLGTYRSNMGGRSSAGSFRGGGFARGGRRR